MTDIEHEVQTFGWTLASFVRETAGVERAVAVSSDGLLIAAAGAGDLDEAERFSAVVSGLASLADGGAEHFGLERTEQIICQMRRGYLFITAISNGSSLAVVANRSCNVGSVGHEIGLLVERCGRLLTPALIRELKDNVLL